MKKMYCIRDTKVGFMTPTVEENEIIAMRNFKFAVQNSDFITANVADFALYEIASFDPKKGTLIPTVPVLLIMEGSECL